MFVLSMTLATVVCSTPGWAQSSPPAGTVTVVAGGAIAGFKGDGGPATAAELQGPMGVAVDSAGNIYIADFLNYRVRKVDINGIISTVAGNGGYTPPGSPGGGASGGSPVGPATSFELVPVSVAVDSAGNLYLSDRDHERIRKVDASGILTIVAGDGEIGESGDGHPATWSGPPGQAGCYTPPCTPVGAALDSPRGIALDAAGNLYIANSGYGSVRKVATDGIISTLVKALPAQPIQSWGMATDGYGGVFFTDYANHQVWRSDSTGNLTLVAGNGTLGYSGDHGQAVSAQLNRPQGVAVDGYGNVFIADTSNGVVRKVTPLGIITTLAAPVAMPMGLAVDGANNLYIADYGQGGSSRILKVQAGVGATAQTILFAGISDVDYGSIAGLQIVLNATASSGLPVRYTVSGPATLISTIAGPTLTLTGAGLVTITASQPGNETYAAAAVVTQTFNVTKNMLTVAADSATRPYGAANPTFTYSISGFVNGDTSAVVSGSAVLTTTAAATSLAGSYPISFSTKGLTAANYDFTYVNGALTVLASPVPQFISTIAGNGTPGYSGDGGQASSAEVLSPEGLVLDSTGNLYIADSLNHVIRKVALDGTISTAAGTGVPGYSGDGGSATSAQLNSPYGIFVDAAGYLYIADSGNNVVRKVALDGSIVTVAGNGRFGYTGDGGAATGATLRLPFRAVVDIAGNLYISDSGNHVIRKVAPEGIITTVAGIGISGYSGDGGPATSAQLNTPSEIAVDAAANLYIADLGNNVIRKKTFAGVISTVAGNSTQGYSGDGGPAISAQLHSPQGIAVDPSGDLFIADTLNNVVREVTAGGVISTVAGNHIQGYSGDGGPATSAKLYAPASVAVEASGDFYVADPGNNRIRKVGPAPPSQAATPIFSLASGGYTGTPVVTITDATAGATIYYTTDGSVPTASSTLYGAPIRVYATETINAIAIAPGYTQSAVATASYMILVAPVIQWPNPAAIASGAALSATQLNATSLDAYGSPVAGTFSYSPAAGTILPLGYHTLSVLFTPTAATYYATATKSVVILVMAGVPNASPVITTVAGNGVQGYTGDGGTATSAEFGTPADAVVDGSGNLYIADATGQVVRKVTPSGVVSTLAGNGTAGYSGDGGMATSAQLQNPYGLAFDNAGNLYIADGLNNAIRKVTPGGIISTVAGNGTIGYSGDGGPAASAQLYTPVGIAFDTAGSLYIGDSNNNVVRKVTPGGLISTVAGNGTYGYSGDGGVATSAQMAFPHGLKVDAAGNLYIADYRNNAIRMVTPGGKISTVAGTGVNGYSGDGGLASSAQLATPNALAFDLLGNLYIADYGNHVIRNLAPAGTITTVAGNGTYGYSGDGGPATSAQLYYPEGIATDPAGQLFIADSFNHVVRKVGSGTVAAAAPTFDLASGSYSGPQTVHLADATASASIYYTTDGSTPTTSSNVYSGSITVSATETVKAIATAPGYTQSPVATASYTITKAAQTISFGVAPTLTYGGSGLISATATSGLVVAFSSATPSICNVLGNKVTGLAAGSCIVTANQAGDAYIRAAPAVQQSFPINPATLTLTANNKTISVGQSLPVFDFTVTGFVNGETAAVLKGSPIASTTAGATPLAGVYSISYAQGSLSAANYNFHFVDGTLSVVAPPNVTITATSTLAKVAGAYQATLKLTNSGSSTANNVQLVTALLGSAPGSPLPQALGTLAAAGGSGTVTLTFPASVGSSGATIVEKGTGTYTGGTFAFSLRLTLP